MRVKFKTSGYVILVLWLTGCGLPSRPLALPDRPFVMQSESESQPIATMSDSATPSNPASEQSQPAPTAETTTQPDPQPQPAESPKPHEQPKEQPAEEAKPPADKPTESSKPAEAVPTQPEAPSPAETKPDTPAPSPASSPAPAEKPGTEPAKPSPPSQTTPDSDEAAKLAEQEALAKLPPFYRLYADLLKNYVDDNGNVDYSTLRRKRGDLLELVRMLDELDPQQVLFWSNNEKIALWLNAHNIFTLKLIVDNYPIKSSVWGMFYPASSIMQISGGRDKTYFKMMGLEYTLREIERDILLKRFEDPRICFAISYASMGGAFLRKEPYYPHRIDRQLEEQAKRFIQSPRGVQIDRNSEAVQLSDIFIWYKDLMISKYGEIKKFRDRPDDIRSYLNCIYPYLKPEDAKILDTGSPAVKFLKYDWQLNEK
jgi:hypothetical protein